MGKSKAHIADFFKRHQGKDMERDEWVELTQKPTVITLPPTEASPLGRRIEID